MAELSVPSLPLEAQVVRARHSRPNLVCVRTGNASVFLKNFDEVQGRTWDLMLSYYKEPDSEMVSAEIVVVGGRSKFTAIKDVFDLRPSLFLSYKAIWLVDDDIEIKFQDIDRLFELSQFYDLDVAQPSLSEDSHASWIICRNSHETCVRYTNFVEVMMPVFSIRAFLICVNSFKQSVSSWGLDFVWAHLIDLSGGKMGIIDLIIAKHGKCIDPEKGAFYEFLRSVGVNPDFEWSNIRTMYAIAADAQHHSVLSSVWRRE